MHPILSTISHNYHANNDLHFCDINCSQHHPQAGGKGKKRGDYLFKDFNTAGPKAEGVDAGTGAGGDGKDEIQLSAERKVQRRGPGKREKAARKLVTDYDLHDPRLR